MKSFLLIVTTLILCGTPIAVLGAGGTCPSAANYLSPANPTAANITLATMGVTSCYFVAASGSDSNNGTSESTPWLHAPGMSECSSECAEVTPAAGEGFIFRGGDTWHFGNSSDSPYTGGQWTWTWSGSSSNPIYIGVDPSWYAGSSWARPILNGDNPLSTSGVSGCSYPNINMVDLNAVRYIHFDNFEMIGLCWNASSSGTNYVTYEGAVEGNANPIYIENNYIHGWTHVSYNGECGSGGVCASNGAAFTGSNQNYGATLQFNVVDGSDSDPYSLSWEQPGAGDGYIVQYNVIRYNGADNTPNECHIIHDNLFEYGYNADDGGTHTDWPMQCYGEASVSGAPNLFYNNIVRHIPDSVSSVVWQFPPSGATDYDFNNIYSDYEGTGNYNNYCQGGGCGNAAFFNNTMEGQGAPAPTGCIICNGSASGSSIASVNNHWIVDSGSTPSAVFQSTTGVSESVPVYQTVSVASGQGYTVANSFEPTSSSGSTVTTSGTNETSGYCTDLGNSNAETACENGITSVSYNSTNHTVVYPAYAPVARPSTGAWNVGAYQYESGSVSFSPTSLSFGDQAVGTTSASEQTTLTNSESSSVSIDIGITGADADDFSISSTTCSSTLSADDSCTVNVTFTPSAVGAMSAEVLESISGATVELSGTGINQHGGSSGAGMSVSLGSGGSLGCAGFLPAPCARSDRTVTQLGSAPSGNIDGTWTDSGPQVNVPWVNDFGEREVRATDGMIPGGKPVGGGNYGPETWWTNYWSVYDSSFGGYYWYTSLADTGESDGGTQRLYQFNPQTMQSTPMCSTWTNCQMPYSGSWSLVTPGLMYYSTGEDLCSWNYDTESGSGTCSDSAGTLVFNFSTCPDYGTYYSGSIFLDGVSYGDTWLQASFGASTMAVYNTSTDSCYWYSTRYGLVGGTDLSAESASLAVATPPSVSSATLTPVTGTGSVPSGTYYVALTMVAGTSGYETTSSVISSPATLSSTGEVEISGQAVGSGNSFYTDNFSVTCNVYAGPSSSTLYEQSTPSASITEFSITSDVVTLTASNAFVAGEEVEVTGLSVGTYLNGQTLTVLSTGLSSSQFEADFTHANVSTTSDSGTATDIKSCSTPTAVVSYATTGSAPPTLNGGGYPLHGSTAGTGNWMNAEVTGTGGGAYVLWEPSTNNTILCKTKDNDQCEGHESVGASNIFYNLQSPNTGGVMSPYDVALSPNADPTESNYEHLIPTGPPTYNFYAAIPSAGCNISDYHSNWTYDNLTDTLPIMWSDFVEPFVGMVAQSGTVSTTADSTTVTGSGTSFSSSWVGDYIWIGTGGEQGTGLGVGAWAQIASVQSTTQLTLSAGAPLTVSGDDFWTYYYPLMGTHCTWDHEIDMVSSSGNGTVWRFAHNRASGLQNQLSNADSSYQALSMPVCSPDGKYCMWATDWANANGQGQLGTQTGMWHGSSGNPSAGCYTSCAWTGSTSYAADQEIIDSNGNEEMATTGGTSGSTEPSWPTTVNGTVSDGGVTWEMSPGCNTPQSTSVAAGGPDDGAGMCRTDIFIVEMK